MAKNENYTEVQLSRILGEHAAGQLVTRGEMDWTGLRQIGRPRGCVNQAAYNERDPLAAFFENQNRARWFDAHYDPRMDAEVLLEKLEDPPEPEPAEVGSK